MYGKIFDSIYDSTLADDWRALITFQQMIVLCDADGVVDMTPHAIARRTSIPIEHIQKGIEILESPDPYSRTPDQEGRRIERIDEHRPWGWSIINHAHYKGLQDKEAVREQNRERQRRKRLKDKGTGHGESVTESDSNAKSRHADADADIKNTVPNGTGENSVSTKGVPFSEIVEKWNSLADRIGLPQTIKVTTALKGQIRQRWKDMPTLQNWDNFFDYIEHNDFLAGRKPPIPPRDKPFRSTLLWITKEGNFAKIAAKEYD